MSKNLSKSDKFIISQLYLKGLSKDDVYSVLKRNNIDLSRKLVRNYLKGQIVNNRGKIGNYTDRIKEIYNSAKSPTKNKKEGKPVITWKEYHEQKEGLQDNFLKSVIIMGLNKDKIRIKNKQMITEKYGKLVKWNEYRKEWESP